MTVRRGSSARRLGVRALVVVSLFAGLLGSVGWVAGDVSPVAAAEIGGGFVGVSPSRVVNTRTSGGCLNGVREFVVAPSAGVPGNAAAVSLNVTVTGSGGPGYVTVFPGGSARPTASNLNYVKGQTVANAVTVKVGAGGRIAVFASGGCPQVIVDVAGYFTAGSAGPGGFVGVSPSRVVNTRSSGGCVNGVREFVVAPSAGAPGNAAAVSLNVTVTAPSGPGYLTVFPTGSARPTASSLNYVKGQTVANAVTVKVGSGGKISVFASGGCPHVIVDLAGYFTAGTAGPGGFVGVTPTRVMNTRTAGGCVKGVRELAVVAVVAAGVPYTATAVSLNVTVTGATGSGYVTVFPSGSPRPTASNLNYVKGQTVANAVTVKVGTGGRIGIFASGGCPHVIVDVAGYTVVDPALVESFVQIDAGMGYGTTCAVTNKGAAKCWGVNGGMVGDGTTLKRPMPTAVVGLGSGVKQVSVGGGHACALTTAGGVKCWGWNAYGQVGSGDPQTSLVPAQVVGMESGVASISAGLNHTCAVTSSGAAKCWGTAGLPVETDTKLPATVPTLGSGVASISSGENHSCAVTTSGAAKCWGSNTSGMLGDGTTTPRAQPVTVSGLGSGVASIDVAAWRTCVVTTAGAVKCWGLGWLGDGGSPDSLVPVAVTGLGSGVAQVAAGTAICARTIAGEVRCWGDGRVIGVGVYRDSPVPVRVVGLESGVGQLTVGSNWGCAISPVLGTRCWGSNGYGQLGDGTTELGLAPVGVLGYS